MAVIDATDMVLGRMASVLAKRALLGEKLDIVNCEKAVITGNKSQILAKYRHRRELGTPVKGPFFARSPDRLVRRVIRGMLPYKRARGGSAFKRIKCHVGLPEEFEKQLLERIDSADISKVPTLKYVDVATVSKFMGAKL